MRGDGAGEEVKSSISFHPASFYTWKWRLFAFGLGEALLLLEMVLASFLGLMLLLIMPQNDAVHLHELILCGVTSFMMWVGLFIFLFPVQRG
jgi:hypothetical protein